MNSTGEQFIPYVSSKRLRDEHTNRYEFVKNFCNGKVVLDIACGTGYGTHLISEVAKSIVGVDISSKAIDYAEKNFKKENIEFVESNCAKINFKDEQFDVIISLETIEHLNELARKEFYKVCKKSLRKDGLFIISTPNKKITSPYTVKPLNKYHVLEFTREKLKKELSEYFIVNQWLGQRYVPIPLTWKLARKLIRLFEILMKIDLGLYSNRFTPVVTEWVNFAEPRILIAVCRKI